MSNHEQVLNNPKEISMKIIDILRRIRGQKTLSELPTSDEPVNMLTKKVFLKGHTVDALILTLTPTGCEWAKRSGGCTMCGEFSGSMGGKTIPSEYHIVQLAKAIAKYAPHVDTPWLRLYNEGSFLNPNELSHDALSVIIGLSSLIKGIERITIESKPEYITDVVLTLLRNSIDHRTEMEIGIGLESQDDFIRNVCLNKGEEKGDYERSVQMIHSYGMRALAYVLIKPPFLTEREALEEAIETVKYAFKIGFDAVKLEPVSVHGYSFVEALSLQGLYEIPWLWTIIETIKLTRYLGEIRVGGLEYYPLPKSVAHNHHQDSDCSQQGWLAIKAYNQTQDPEIFNTYDCECRNTWHQEIQKMPEALLPERLVQTLNQFSLDDYLQSRHS